jgi:hypothetical protein
VLDHVSLRVTDYERSKQFYGGPAIHVAFAGKGRAAVDAFHRAALAARARDNGAPELRPQDHANYYDAFVRGRSRSRAARG